MDYKVTKESKEDFLKVYDREHTTTMKVLRAYPEDKLDFKPHPTSQSARELAYRALIASTPEDKLSQTIRFFVGPKTMGDIPRLVSAWWLLHDQIHHRGQFSVYLRMVGGKVPSIYGPSLDEPWF